jgi:hypothetical protein
MTGFRVLLAAMLTAVTIYTAMTIAGHGWSLLPVFFTDIGKMSWPGQFDLDFMFMLALSGLWVAWRHRFSPVGLGLAVLAFFGGSPFLCVYVLINSFRARGDMREMLLGRSRAAA